MDSGAPALLRIQGRLHTLAAGLPVRRVLPAVARRAVGPFVFFDHMGPVDFEPGADSDVGGHPHIGLATVTYLFEGSLMHRDSLGSVQLIQPGAINWMTAGRGIVHSERVPEAERGQARRLHGLQLWLALPPEREELEPGFQHVAAAEIPQCTPAQGVRARLLAGQAWGLRSPVRTASPTLYLDLDLDLAPHTTWSLPALADEMAVYSPQHPLQIDGQQVSAAEMAVLPGGRAVTLQAPAQGARLVVIGGAALERPVRMWWNYVSSDPQRIAQAARRWEAGGFDAIPGETQRLAGPPVPFKP